MAATPKAIARLDKLAATRKGLPKITLTNGRKIPFMLPGREPRPVQVEAIQKIEALFRGGAEYVVLEAPTATGKSACAATLGEFYGSSWITTLTKQLQEQYLKDFTENMQMKPLYGRAAFPCARAGGGRTCADGAILFLGTPCGAPKGPGAHYQCPYKIGKGVAFETAHTVANGHSHLFNVVYAQGETRPIPRELLVVDEAHALEGLLMGFVEVDIKLNKLPGLELQPLPDGDVVAPFAAWLQAHRPQFEAKLKSPDPVVQDAFRTLLGKVGGFEASRVAGVEWVVEKWERGFTLKPINVHYWAPKFLRAVGKRVLLMSATIIDAHALVTSLGLDPDKGDFVQLGCPIPKENRKVVIGDYVMSTGGKDTKKEWEETHGEGMAKTVDALFNDHANEKGLLLTPSNELLGFIRKFLSAKNSQRLLVASGEDRVARYNEHINSKFPTVLGAPGYWEGADLVGDRARFLIIPKIPWPMLSAQVRARKERERGWYEWNTVSKLVQGIGRVVRGETDYAITYVLDTGMRQLLLKKGSLIPPWMAEACVMAENDS